MPGRVSLSKNLSLQHSVSVAHKALEKGGSVKLDRKGALEVTGGTFLGRIVRYFKSRIFPDKIRQQNHAVIAALNETINKEFGTGHRLKIQTVLSNAESNRHFLRSFIDTVSNIRAGAEYKPAKSTAGEVRNARRFGFAANVTAKKSKQAQPAASAGETLTARAQLFWYNRTMNDLYIRFPKLRNLPAITTLKLDTKPTVKDAVAAYEPRTRSMELASHKLKQVSRMTLENVKSGYLTPKQDYGGMIHHEYAHHLSNRIVPEKVWVPKLVDALKAGGIAHARVKSSFGDPLFDKRTADAVARSIGKYAATDARECAAEILSWYMNPEYGKSVAPMPGYLENWVNECFPMLKKN